MELDMLRDDELLMVFRRVETRDLIACRAVSRRWRDLSVHSDVWNHRELSFNDSSDKGELIFALSYATCARQMAIFNVDLLGSCKFLAATTSCAVTRLTLRLKQDCMTAALILHRQASLGRLRYLSIDVVPFIFNNPVSSWSELGDLLRTMNAVKGLEELKLVEGHPELAEPLPVALHALPDESTEPSLKKVSMSIMFNLAMSHQEATLEFLLRCHASSLQELEVHLMTECFALAELVSTIPNLSRLKCGPMKNMIHILRCPSLKNLCLDTYDWEEDDDEPWIADTVAFLRAATHLKEVSFMFKESVDDFLSALATSGFSEVQKLYFYSFYMPCPSDGLIKPLANAMPRLRHLQYLSLEVDEGVDEEVDKLFSAISPSSSPSLTDFSVTTAGCCHLFMKRQDVQDLLSRNPRLHLQMRDSNDSCWCRGILCDQNVENLLRRKVGTFTHDQDKECDSLFHGAKDIFWLPFLC